MGIRLCVLAATALSVVALTAPAADAASIRVPLDRDHPGLGKLTVRYAVVRHTDRSQPPLEPIVAFEGGPGYGSIGSASTYLFMLGKLHRRHDLIVMDQRGTGSSGAIDCPALQTGSPRTRQAAAACARRLGRAGERLRHRRRGRRHGRDPAQAACPRGGRVRRLVRHVRGPGVRRPPPEQDRGRWCSTAPSTTSFDPFEPEESVVAAAAWRAVCARAGPCPGILRLDRRRLTAGSPRTRSSGRGRDADGVRRHFRLAPAELGSLVVRRDLHLHRLPRPAGRAARAPHGDRAPMLRLAAEDVAFNASGGSPALLGGRLPGGRLP